MICKVLQYKIYKAKGFGLFCTLLYLQYLEQCLTDDKCSKNIFEWMNVGNIYFAPIVFSTLRDARELKTLGMVLCSHRGYRLAFILILSFLIIILFLLLCPTPPCAP